MFYQERMVGHESPAQSGSFGNVPVKAPGVVTGGTFPFYVGLHQPSDAQHFLRCCISIHRIWKRKKPVLCGSVMVDSGAFTKLAKYGCYPEAPEVYAAQLHRLHTQGVVNIEIAWSQDYMCEPFMLAKTGLTIAEHQRLTIERFDAIKAELDRLFGGSCPFPLGPILQGFSVEDYLSHIDQYGDRLTHGMWVGVGSVCKRQGSPQAIDIILSAIKAKRPDLRLHGFGVKITSLSYWYVRQNLFSADSMSWSYGARMLGRDGNDWREAKLFEERIAIEPDQPQQMRLF